MVRRCVVPSCSSTDLTTLVHRFPRKHCTVWQSSLQLSSYSVKDLLEKYVVCAHHFRLSDYRHKESKHLNTTAIPTLDVISAADKIPEVQTNVFKVNKRHTDISSTSIITDSETCNLSSNLLVEKTQTYSNCVTSVSPLPLAKINVSSEPAGSDTLNESNFYSDCDIIEEETDMDEEMLIESNESNFYLKYLPDCDSVTEHFLEDDEDTYTENTSFVDEITSNCDDGEVMDENEILFKDFSRKELIDELLAARSRISELETKLDNIQKAHLSVVQNINNFNKVMIS